MPCGTCTCLFAVTPHNRPSGHPETVPPILTDSPTLPRSILRLLPFMGWLPGATRQSVRADLIAGADEYPQNGPRNRRAHTGQFGICQRLRRRRPHTGQARFGKRDILRPGR